MLNLFLFTCAVFLTRLASSIRLHSQKRDRLRACESVTPIYVSMQRGRLRGAARRIVRKEVAMTIGALQTSAIALGAAAFAMMSTIPAADAATAVHHYGHAAHAHVAHARVAHGHVYGHVARARAGTRHYVWRNGRRYAYGAATIPGRPSRPELSAAFLAVWRAAIRIPATTPTTGRMIPAATMASETATTGHTTATAMAHTMAVTAAMGGGYGGYGGYGHGRVFGGHFNGGAAHLAGGNFGHMGSFGGSHFGGFGGGHVGGFGGGHLADLAAATSAGAATSAARICASSV